MRYAVLSGAAQTSSRSTTPFHRGPILHWPTRRSGWAWSLRAMCPNSRVLRRLPMPDKKAWSTCTTSRWTAPRGKKSSARISPPDTATPKPDLPQLSPGNAEVLASYSRQKCMALFARVARNGTWLCPTLHNSWRHAHNADAALIDDERARFYPEVFREYWKTKTSDERRRSPGFVARSQGYYELVREMIPDARHAGVGLLAGSDSGANEYSVPGFSLHDELAELVGAGLTPMQVLQSAALNAARYLGITDAFGTVELGKTADLVLLEGNPLEDIRNTRKISAVVVNGKIFRKPELQKIFDYALRNSVKKRP